MVERALDQRLGARLAVFFEQILFERAGVDADPHRAVMVLGRLDDLAHPLRRADVAGVDPEARRAALGRLDRAAIVEMDVGDDRHRHLAHDLLQRKRRFLVRARHRTMSAPARSSAWICSTVALFRRCVTVLVIDCTVMGASPPTGTLPTHTLRLGRRWMSRYGLTLIMILGRKVPSAYRTLSRQKKEVALNRERRFRRQVRSGRARHCDASPRSRRSTASALPSTAICSRSGIAGAERASPGFRRHLVDLPGLQHAREDNEIVRAVADLNPAVRHGLDRHLPVRRHRRCGHRGGRRRSRCRRRLGRCRRNRLDRRSRRRWRRIRPLRVASLRPASGRRRRARRRRRRGEPPRPAEATAEIGGRGSAVRSATQAASVRPAGRLGTAEPVPGGAACGCSDGGIAATRSGRLRSTVDR